MSPLGLGVAVVALSAFLIIYLRMRMGAKISTDKTLAVQTHSHRLILYQGNLKCTLNVLFVFYVLYTP